MNSSILFARGLSTALVFGMGSCEPEKCWEIPAEVEERFVAMAGPLGCEPSGSGIPSPPGGCDGAEAFVESTRAEYQKLWEEGGCGTEPPDLTRFVSSYEAAFAAKHRFVSHAIPRAGFTIAAREFGPEHAARGPTIVLMHGFPDDQHLYDLVAPALGATHHTVTFDFVGWGESTTPPGHVFSFEGLREDLDAVLAYFGPSEVLPVVHDASGWPGIDWALDHPESTKALVLLNTAYHPIEGGGPPYVIRALSALDLRPRFLDALGTDELMTRALLRAQVGGFFQDSSRKEAFLPLFEHKISRTRAALIGLTEKLRDALVARVANVPRMRNFPKPVTIAFGAEDPYLSPAVARGFADAFPGSRLELIERAGHYVQLDRPETVALHVRAAAEGR
jgi:pimeloyl-ACP methyl ester carboxylesterase